MARKNKTSRVSAQTKFAEKISLTLYFDTEAGLLNFRRWYLDGGGEQVSTYYAEDTGKAWMYLKPPDNCCPHCEFWEESFDEKMPRFCPNCDRLIVKARH